MGLFSRPPSSADAPPKARPSVSSEAAARALRIRARRRLIGALALVLAVVIVVPMLFDAPPPDPGESLIVVPAVVAPVPDMPLPVPDASPAAGGVIIAQDASGQDAPPAPTTETPTPAAAPTRTDDGTVALALLEGRTLPGAAPTPPAGFVLQIAAYTTQQDADTQRDRLQRAGVTNAYVEAAARDGKTTWRVRVGPFSSRDAAQAAQTRIRALGDYQDAFILTQ